jgi:riboflavin kinase/FMN adenylyltransferase
MKRLFSVERVAIPTALVIGVFDGLHLGHQRLLKLAREKASARNLPLLAVTFDPHPAEVLGQATGLLLLSPEDKVQLLVELGVDVVLMVHFNQQVASLAPNDFINELLVLNPELVLVGENFKFGENQAGNASVLKGVGKKLGFEVIIVSLQKVSGQVASSTLVRDYLNRGEVEKVAQLLGRSFSIKGRVVQGSGLASKVLKIPTANLAFSDRLVRPAYGVYAGEVGINELKYPAIIYFGTSPTLGLNQEALEVYIPDFKGELKGEEVEVAFLKFIREERTFKDADKLRQQVEEDLKKTQSLFKSRH